MFQSSDTLWQQVEKLPQTERDTKLLNFIDNPTTRLRCLIAILCHLYEGDNVFSLLFIHEIAKRALHHDFGDAQREYATAILLYTYSKRLANEITELQQLLPDDPVAISVKYYRY